MKNTTAEDSGVYRVTAENPAGADSASFDVKVKSEHSDHGEGYECVCSCECINLS